MRYSITFAEADYSALTGHLFQPGFTERAAYLLCGLSITEFESRLLVREVIPVTPEDVTSASERHMEISPRSFMRAMKRADSRQLSFIFVHSHPDGTVGHSPQDDITERSLFRTAYTRIRGQALHASITFSNINRPQARVWHPGGATSSVEVIRVIGNRFRFFQRDLPPNINTCIFDRQVRAFGLEVQQILKNLHIGIVGTGGTGSAMAEQLIRLGTGRLSLFDGEMLEASNVTRVYGSGLADIDRPKVEVIQQLAKNIGLGTEIRAFPKHITVLAVAKALRDCDLIFGCTDDEWGRSILCKLAIDYHIPVIDMGVKIDSKDGYVLSVQGRVTTLVAGSACLSCRGRITAEGIRTQVIERYVPTQAEELRRQQYAPELQENAAAVIAFTTAVASTALAELLHRLTGFMGVERVSSEVIHLFDESRIRTNCVSPLIDCFCGDSQRWGLGDQNPFLGMLWQE
jgi:hypothetical protein